MKRSAVTLLLAAALGSAHDASAQSPLSPAAVAQAAAVATRAMRVAGHDSGALAVDPLTGEVLFAVRPDIPRIPASVEKLYTLATALGRFGADGALRTSVLGVGEPDAAGVWHGNLYLRGGGDPTLAGKALAALARRLAGLTRVDGSIVGDESLLDRRRGGGELNGRLSGLVFAREGSAAYAAARLAKALRAAGIPVSGRSRAGTTPAQATVLASVDSPPMRTLARLTALSSDNFLAEMLLKDLGAAFGGAGTTRAGAAVARAWLAPLGIHARIEDGSGLSRSDSTTPRDVVRLLTGAPPGLRSALPVAGRSGTLRGRMRRGPAAGNCDAKTGTLRDVSTLAGWCGTRVAFALMMNHVSVGRARALQDRIVEALAALGE